jgi:hypothetical protein
MKKISFDTKNGYLLLDSIMMAPLNESEFIKTAKENDIEIEDKKTNTYVHNLSTCGSLNEFEFGINFTFENYCMKSVWLSWDGGNTKKYGYDTTENQLISDKNRLAKLLAKVLGKSPDEIKKRSPHLIFHGATFQLQHLFNQRWHQLDYPGTSLKLHVDFPQIGSIVVNLKEKLWISDPT